MGVLPKIENLEDYLNRHPSFDDHSFRRKCRDDSAFYYVYSKHPKIIHLLNCALHGGRYGMFHYILYCGIRLIEMRRILKPTGHIFVHCDWVSNTYLTQLLDYVFGHSYFKNDIKWCNSHPDNAVKVLPRTSQNILLYGSDDGYFNHPRMPHKHCLLYTSPSPRDS